ncbi:hypothetical protein G7046_g5445 [Stylonectria norvegica]|nr:hypothetical protein G7046_g5445 [Stylonectria norvegica]
MAITEFVFPPLNPDPVLLQQYKKEIPAAVEATFADTAGLTDLYRGKIIEARDISDDKQIKHTGAVFILTWDHVSSFNTFFSSETFSRFGKTMKPFVTGPPIPELFSTEDNPQPRHAIEEKYTQYFRVSNTTSSKEEVDAAWQTLVSKLGTNVESSVSGWGVQDTTGTFAGIIGWQSLQAFESTTASPVVKEPLLTLASHGTVVSYLLELTQVPH